MKNVGGMFFRILDIFANFVLLNLLWLICCIPIFTIFPSTTALFAVTNKWLHNGIGTSVIHSFFKAFQRNFKKSFIIGIVWGIIAFILSIDFMILSYENFVGRYFLFVLFIFFLIVYLFTSIFIFYVILLEDYPVLQTIKEAIVLSVRHLLHSVICMLIIVLFLFITFHIHLFIILLGSMLAFIISFVLQTTNRKQEQMF